MHSQRWRRMPKFRMAAAACAVLAVAVAACSGSGSPSGGGAAGGTRETGGTATWALNPSAVPNYIFPFASSTYFSTVNAEEFQYLMYRPLYWFGNGASPTLNASLSLADPPVYHGRQVTITMKGWKWSNGETVSAQDLRSTTGNGPVDRQLYFRQALQYLMNQRAVINGPLHGYGAYTVGPVGTYPPTSYLSPQGEQGDPFPYNPAKARQLLTSHGWKVGPNGITTCQDPSLCGPGISQGHQLVFNLPYATGVDWITAEMTQL
jgi:ABC-type transport system substrate-binding protein